MPTIVDTLSQWTGAAFAELGLPAELGQVRTADRPDLAQYQCNGAMAAARQARRPPREIAESLAEKLRHRPELRSVEVAGPGFLNLSCSTEFLAQQLAEQSAAWHCGIRVRDREETVVLDYGGPNIAKPMHVGHLRASIIGDSLRRLCHHAGYRVLGDVHMGDWGTHMGTIISAYFEMEGGVDRVLGVDLEDREQVNALLGELTQLYPRESAAVKSDEARRQQALEATLRMQEGEQPHFRMWEIIRAASVISMRENFAALNVHFDLWKGEADVHHRIAPMVEKFREQGLAESDAGATIIRVADEADRKEVPPLILYKRDGAVMYGTTDLATIDERVEQFDPRQIVYVVDQRQHLHFEQVFRSARKARMVADGVDLVHAGFGTVNGPDGKPFKTREGGAMRLDELIREAEDKARQRLEEAHLGTELSTEELQEVAHRVAVAAIRFADLQNPRTSDYIFDLDRFVRFEGKTGPYLQYQVVRIVSLLRKAGWKEADLQLRLGQSEGVDPAMALGGAANPIAPFILQAADEPLALLLLQFPDVFDLALSQYMPHYLCDYAFRLANAFSSFYAACHILSESDEGLRQSRLALCATVGRQLMTLLEILGIEVPERM